jgi:hypothetical protein
VFLPYGVTLSAVMGSEFITYFRLGVSHIADLRGYDHILFLVALTAGYVGRDWKHLLWLVTAFTLGHSLALALATLDLVRVRAVVIELLIAVTIVATGAYALWSSRRSDPVVDPPRQRVLYVMAGGFGLIHGLGFSTFLRSALGAEEGILWPLFAFNVGLEVGQLVIVVVIVLLGTLACDVGGLRRRYWVMGISGIAVLAGLRMMLERMAG